MKADLLLTDPPYNVSLEERNADLVDAGYHNNLHRERERIENDSFKTDEECAERLWGPSFHNCREWMKDDASFYVFSPQGGTMMMMMMMINREIGNPRHQLIWAKNAPALSRCDYSYKHEPIIYGWTRKHHFYGMGWEKTSLWHCDRPTSSKLHPTMKPIRLLQNALLNSTKEGDLVIDPFGGSGSTMVACESLGRKCRSMEIDRHYFLKSIERMKDEYGLEAEWLSDDMARIGNHLILNGDCTDPACWKRLMEAEIPDVPFAKYGNAVSHRQLTLF